MPQSQSDESDYGGIGHLFNNSADSSGDSGSLANGEDGLKQPPGIALPKQVFDWVRDWDQGTEDRILDPRTPSEVPSVSAVPSLNRSEETLSITAYSTNEAMDERMVLDARPRDYLVDRNGHDPVDTLSESSISLSSDSSRSASPVETNATSPRSNGTSIDIDIDDQDDILLADGSVDSALWAFTPPLHSSLDLSYGDDEEPTEDVDDEDSPDGTDGAAAKENTGSTLSGSHVSDSKAGPGSKRRQGELQNGDGDDREESTTRRSKRFKLGNEEHLRLACPFYKFDPVRYRRCHAHVLKRNSYVKQHLFRAHRQPPYCIICLEALPGDEALKDHLRAQQCQKREYVPPDGINPEQERKLKSRLGLQSKSEIEQWFEIYAIIFPGAQKPKSPYLDNGLSEDVESFREFIGRQGSAIFCQELDKRQGSISVLPQSDIERLNECVQSTFSSVFDQWQTQRRGVLADGGSRQGNDDVLAAKALLAPREATPVDTTCHRTGTGSTTFSLTLTEPPDGENANEIAGEKGTVSLHTPRSMTTTGDSEEHCHSPAKTVGEHLE